MYNKIAIVRKVDDGMAPKVNELAQVIGEYGKLRNRPVYDHHLGTNLPDDAEDILFVSLGGDGTLLYAAEKSMYYENTGVVGFNLGRLGFLTEEIDKATNNPSFQRVVNDTVTDAATRESIFEFLDGIFGNLVTVKADPRMMLAVTIFKSGGRQQTHYAMNEVTLYTSLRNFIDTRVAVNGMLVGKIGGNGAAVSTATGSTALALSAGGAIVSPNTNILQIVPLLPHKVAKQPIITSGRDEVILRTQTTSRSKKVYVLADSRQIEELDYEKGEEFVDVVVKRATKDVTLWRPSDWNFFDVLSKKLEWR